MIESSDEQIGVTRLYCKGENISSFTGFSIRVGVHGGSKDGIGYVFGLFAGLKYVVIQIVIELDYRAISL